MCSYCGGDIEGPPLGCDKCKLPVFYCRKQCKRQHLTDPPGGAFPGHRERCKSVVEAKNDLLAVHEGKFTGEAAKTLRLLAQDTLAATFLAQKNENVARAALHASHKENDNLDMEAMLAEEIRHVSSQPRLLSADGGGIRVRYTAP